MPSLSEIVASLYGAWRLARFDARGLASFTTTLAGFWRSFFAAVIVAPLYALSLMMPLDDTAGVPRGFGFALVEIVAYVVSWVAYPVAAEWLSRRLRCRDRLIAYLTAYNWSTVIQHAMIASIIIATGADLISLQAAQLIWLVATSYLLAYVWFIARTALAIPPFVAAAFVAVDLLLSYAIGSVAATIEATLIHAANVQ